MHKKNESCHTYYDVATEGAGDAFLKRFEEMKGYKYWRNFVEAYESK